VSKTKEVWDSVAAMNLDVSLALAPIYTEIALTDPKRLSFILARYKFCAKMLTRSKSTIEIGCGEGLGSLTLLNETKADILAVDFDQSQINYANNTLLPALQDIAPDRAKRIRFKKMDVLTESLEVGRFDSLISVDVIEHIETQKEHDFLAKCAGSLVDRGVAIIGTPNDFASPYASERSQLGHINMYTPDRLVETLEQHFTHIFLFSMNDEIVHTGFDKMAHYLMALCIK
jgi:cyclopropane fatty-acyl-phospholipid synthase-like methyltransferase